MNRVSEYIRFSIWFVGLGYGLLWPVSSVGDSGEPLGASLLCGDGGSPLAELLCRAPHPLQLSLPFHAIGLLAAVCVAVLLPLRMTARWRRPAAVAVAGSLLAIRIPAVLPHPRRRKLSRPRRPVKPRAQFGLRGARR